MNKQNIYYAARMEAAKRDRVFASRERTAEQLYTSVESLADYENDGNTPPCDVVACMCRVYHTPALKNEHVRACCPLMREGVAEKSELARAALSWITTLNSVEALGREFAAMAIDGRIDPEEVAASMAIRKKAVELTRVMQETITAIDTALHPDAGKDGGRTP